MIEFFNKMFNPGPSNIGNICEFLNDSGDEFHARDNDSRDYESSSSYVPDEDFFDNEIKLKYCWHEAYGFSQRK